MIKQIIGLTGPIRAGKSSALNILREKGYKGYKFSNVINREIKKRRKKITRKLQQDIGNKLRERFGGDYWAKKLLKIAEKEKSGLIVIDGIRNPDEINFLKAKGSIIIGINADYEIRKRRFLKDPKIGDSKNEKDFNQVEKRDRGIGEKGFGQQVSACLKLADIVIINNWEEVEPFREILEQKLRKTGIPKFL